MKSKIITVFWGGALILVSGFLLAQTLGYISFEDLSEAFWAIALGFASAVFFLFYFLNGVRKWGWLFPALVCAVLCIWMMVNDPQGIFSGILLASLALPFYVGFAMNRKRWGLLIPAYILTFPATIVLTGDSELSGASFLLLLALPFFFIYFRSKRNWWALIPAGTLASLGLMVHMEFLAPTHENIPFGIIELGSYIYIPLLGLAISFGVLWLRRKNQPTGWTIYPAAGLVAASILAFSRGQNFEHYWPISILVVGVLLLVTAFIKTKPAAGQQAFEDRY